MRTAATLLTAFVLVVGLAGCAPSGGGYSATTAQTLQSDVLSVSEAAAAGDPATALARLDELDARLLDLLAKGAVDQARFDSVSAAIALVRGDLEAAIAAQSESTGNNGNGNGKPDKPGKPEKPGKD